VYKDTLTATTYKYGADFKNFNDILFEGKSVNDLMEEGRLTKILYEETGEFSHSAVTKGILNKGYVQCKFLEGFDGMAIAVSVTNGDGEVPVFVEFKDGRMVKLWIDFESDGRT